MGSYLIQIDAKKFVPRWREPDRVGPRYCRLLHGLCRVREPGYVDSDDQQIIGRALEFAGAAIHAGRVAITAVRLHRFAIVRRIGIVVAMVADHLRGKRWSMRTALGSLHRHRARRNRQTQPENDEHTEHSAGCRIPDVS